MGTKANAIGKIEIFKLFTEGPLEACVTGYGCSLHDPVNDHQVNGWKQHAACPVFTSNGVVTFHCG